MTTIYAHELAQYAADSRRTLGTFRADRFWKSRTGTLIVYLALPFVILAKALPKRRPPSSMIAAAGLAPLAAHIFT